MGEGNLNHEDKKKTHSTATRKNNKLSDLAHRNDLFLQNVPADHTYELTTAEPFVEFF
jgi:hypothetical protein